MEDINNSSSRRSAIKKMTAATAVAIAGNSLLTRLSAAELVIDDQLKGRIHHSVCRWCFKDISLDDLCKAAKNIGLTSIELLHPEEWPTIKNMGLLVPYQEQRIWVSRRDLMIRNTMMHWLKVMKK